MTPSLTPELLVDEDSSVVVDDQAVDAAVVELLLAGATPAGEAHLVGDQTLLILGPELLAAALTPAWRGSGLESGWRPRS
jgi:hypothetical protein